MNVSLTVLTMPVWGWLQGAVFGLLEKHRDTLDGIAIENVYHNKNISSRIKTGKVIGLVEWLAFCEGFEVLTLTHK